MADNFFNENKELYWYAHDDSEPGEAKMYAPHMAGTMFEPFTKQKGTLKIHKFDHPASKGTNTAYSTILQDNSGEVHHDGARGTM